MKLGILISGEGTNLQAIIDQIREEKLRAEIALVISNQETAYGLVRARKAGIATAVVRHQDYSREAFEEAMIQRLEAKGVELVVLAGFMRILTKKFVDHFQGRIMNIHPALLPSFPGTGAIEKAWASGTQVTGVTVHFVDPGVDTGPILLQREVPIREGESLESLTQRIHEVEHELYPEAIRLYTEGKLKKGKK